METVLAFGFFVVITWLTTGRSRKSPKKEVEPDLRKEILRKNIQTRFPLF